MRPIAITAFVLAFFPVSAFAQGTPDEITPSREHPCEAFTGSAQGLCNSYCEARDCNDPRVRAADVSCEKTAAKFLKLTHLTEMPCPDIEPPPQCTIDAQDDYFTMNDPMSYTIQPLENDAWTPTEVSPTIPTFEPAAGVTYNSGPKTFTGAWDASERTYNRVFTYTACCDANTCDTATITILGS